VIAALASAIRLPISGLDLYIKDRYVVVPRPSLIVIVLVALGLPTLAFTIRCWSSR
jgi:hypothetical protein